MTHAPENTTNAPLPEGFAPLVAGGPYIQHNGPLYVLHQGKVVKFGFRVERRAESLQRSRVGRLFANHRLPSSCVRSLWN